MIILKDTMTILTLLSNAILRLHMVTGLLRPVSGDVYFVPIDSLREDINLKKTEFCE